MSFNTPQAYLPSDLLDSDDDVAQDTLGMKAYILNNILDDDEEKTADSSPNVSNGNISGTECSSIFSVTPFVEQVKPEDYIVGWKCLACDNFNVKKRDECKKCEKARATEDPDVTKQERKL